MTYPDIQTYSLSGDIEYSFTDSGAPPNSVDYTTLLVIHGTAFNAYQFHKVHAYSHGLNLRTVLLHRRDFVGSTPYSSSEIEEAAQGDRVFWERTSAQLAEFLCMFIEREKIPKTISESQRQKSAGNGGRGGLTILGWSFGCATVLSFLGIPRNSIFVEDQYKVLKEYIGDFMLYDPPHVAFGYEPPSDNVNYVPWDDPSLALADVPVKFSVWVSSYCDHPCYDPATRSLRPSGTIYDLDGLSHGKDENSVSYWTEEEKAKGIEGDTAGTDISMFRPAMQETLRTITDQALFNAVTRESWFPDVKGTFIVGTRTIWVCVWAEIETKKIYYRLRAENMDSENQGRRIRFFDMDGSNHFSHWDQPQEFVQVVAEGIRLH